jgi:hypothetical protein
MTSDYLYLLDRIRTADFEHVPLPHLYLRNFLANDDFGEVSESQDIQLRPVTDADHLFSPLETAGDDPIKFPGCTSSKSAYIKALNMSSPVRRTHAACEGQRMALKLQEPRNEAVGSLDDFLRLRPDLPRFPREVVPVEEASPSEVVDSEAGK